MDICILNIEVAILVLPSHNHPNMLQLVPYGILSCTNRVFITLISKCYSDRDHLYSDRFT